MLRKVADTLWIMKNTSTKEGRERYGAYFQNYDELLMLHACSVMDPRCDQGHTGPHFMTFHRLLLLKLEMSMLAVDSSIEAMPYWDMAKDSYNGAYRNDPDKYIFTGKYFGNFTGTGPNHEVEDGLFANWPIAEWTSATFGKDSPLADAGICIRSEFFNGTQASTCDECCGKSDCTCPENATYKRYLRAHDDCSPKNVRWPQDPDCPNSVKLGGTYELVYSEDDFKACEKYPENVASWMQWHNCQDPGLFFCSGKKTPEELAQLPSFVDMMNRTIYPSLVERIERAKEKLDPSDSGLKAAQKAAGALWASLLGGNSSEFVDSIKEVCQAPMIYGYYHKQGTPATSRQFPHMHHGNAHFKFCRDFEDVTTSPNDVGGFTGHHSNIDRSNMHFMMRSFRADPTMEAKSWLFPKTQSDLLGHEGLPPYGLGGPFSAAGLLVCQSDKDTYPFYRFGQAPWTPGTLLNDTANAGYPFVDIFNSSCSDDQDCSGRSTGGYTHHDVLYFTAPQRTPYTYDTLEHYYY